MRTYLEAIELIGLGQEGDFIRAEITDKSDTEIEQIKTAIKDIMLGKDYIFLRHFCPHDTGGSCETESEI